MTGTVSPHDSSDPVWYAEGLRFECTQCGICCSGEPGYVWVSDDEILSMAKQLQMEIATFESKYIRKIGPDKSLKERPGGDCILLDGDTRKCSVYEGRPIQCRTWPFWDSTTETPAAWKETCAECPGAGKGKLYSIEQIAVLKRAKSV